MARPVEVKALPNFRIWLRYDDGTTGDVDLSDLVGRGVFNAWPDVRFFNSVTLIVIKHAAQPYVVAPPDDDV